MTKHDWIHTFATELVVRVRPAYGMKLARTVAGTEWPQQRAQDPARAAHAWAARHPITAPAPRTDPPR